MVASFLFVLQIENGSSNDIHIKNQQRRKFEQKVQLLFILTAVYSRKLALGINACMYNERYIILIDIKGPEYIILIDIKGPIFLTFNQSLARHQDMMLAHSAWRPEYKNDKIFFLDMKVNNTLDVTTCL